MGKQELDIGDTIIFTRHARGTCIYIGKIVNQTRMYWILGPVEGSQFYSVGKGNKVGKDNVNLYKFKIKS